jgi:TrmH family RNA methyltransferase
VKEQLSRLRTIQSRQNALLKELRRAFHAGEPTDDGYCAIESVRTIEEAIRSGLRFRTVVFSESARNRAEKLLPQVSTHVETVIVPDEVFSSAVATDTPQGVAALVRIPQHTLAKIMEAPDPLLVVAAGLQDPGNLGTMVRSAEAFGAAAVLITEGSASQFNPKVIRASAGSMFRLPVVKTAARELLTALREKKVRLLATSSHKGTAIDQADLTGGVALFIGSEGAGLPKALANEMDATLVIPHSAGVESLNAGVAASIVLYEASRQRRSEKS